MCIHLFLEIGWKPPTTEHAKCHQGAEGDGLFHTVILQSMCFPSNLGEACVSPIQPGKP